MITQQRERERGGERGGEREREREREKFLYVFSHYITVGPTTQREEVLYEKEKFF
jgi:hypothetical protein